MMTGNSPDRIDAQKNVGSDSPAKVWLIAPARGGSPAFPGLLPWTFQPDAIYATPRAIPPRMPRLPSTPVMPRPVTSSLNPV